MRMPNSRGKEPGRDSLDDVLRHLKELRSASKETVRKMAELERKIEAMREQQKPRPPAARGSAGG